nr:uncharacterized protein LOC119718436 [Anas platyrhynchos]XP_038042881.1 uncharacterized protein LOC119718436 [Anas platyrhynchos]XP_038042882.1 uncharacterized protein LOC119718436 [Anas platyrhynchos]XP_038042883.1 uncharacterized protein LOC119718436 [Anas platyrhynchos]
MAWGGLGCWARGCATLRGDRGHPRPRRSSCAQDRSRIGSCQQMAAISRVTLGTLGTLGTMGTVPHATLLLLEVGSPLGISALPPSAPRPPPHPSLLLPSRDPGPSQPPNPRAGGAIPLFPSHLWVWGCGHIGGVTPWAMSIPVQQNWRCLLPPGLQLPSSLGKPFCLAVGTPKPLRPHSCPIPEPPWRDPGPHSTLNPAALSSWSQQLTYHGPEPSKKPQTKVFFFVFFFPPSSEVWELAFPTKRVPFAPGVSGMGNGNPTGGRLGVGSHFWDWFWADGCKQYPCLALGTGTASFCFRNVAVMDTR